MKRISELADADYNLTQKCIEHLLYYNCLIMVDIFQFSSIYAVTAEITSLVNDPLLQEECINYISIHPTHPGLTTTTKLSFPAIFELYASLRQGYPLKQWCKDNKDLLHGIDIRRFVSFGVIKGVLYRVHKYPVSNDPSQLDKKLPMAKFLDGNHHFDDICTDLQISEKAATERLAKGYGDIQFIER